MLGSQQMWTSSKAGEVESCIISESQRSHNHPSEVLRVGRNFRCHFQLKCFSLLMKNVTFGFSCNLTTGIPFSSVSQSCYSEPRVSYIIKTKIISLLFQTIFSKWKQVLNFACYIYSESVNLHAHSLKNRSVCANEDRQVLKLSQQAQCFLQEKHPRNVTTNVSQRIFCNIYCLVQQISFYQLFLLGIYISGIIHHIVY